VQSSAFAAGTTGEVVWSPVLTNSAINFPVTVLLSQPMAKELNLSAADAASGGNYVPLPQFLTMTGTFGDPQKQIKKTALVGLTVKSVTGGLLNKVTNTNAPVGNLLNNLLRGIR
jgi:hypothetical protein